MTRSEDAAARMKWGAIIALSAAQFVMVLDSTVMNVSISKVVADLHTTIEVMQFCITFYTLVMASLMLVGAKIGDIIGRRRAFTIGLVVYACGSTITAFSPNAAVLFIGWSIVEGLGAVLVVPAIAALAAANYEGRQRATAYGALGGIAGAAAAAGPLIGGWCTTVLTWRIVFLAEVVIVLIVLLLGVPSIKDALRTGPKATFDGVGALLSATGLLLVVFAILQSSRWGLIQPIGAPEINGHVITPLGFSVVPFLISGGLVLLYGFFMWERRMESQSKAPLLRTEMLKIPQLKSGLASVGAQYLVTSGVFFVIPVYLQVVLGKDALQTGIQILPMSVGLILAALGGARLSAKVAPRRIVRAGMLVMVVSALGLMATIDPELNSTQFNIFIFLLGVGIGLLASQLGNVNLSSVDESRSSEVGGVQGVSQNLGASLGTALIGGILLAGLTTQFVAHIQADQNIPANVQQQIVTSTSAGVAIVSEDEATKYATAAGLPPDQVKAVVADYTSAQLEAIKTSLLAVAILAFLSLGITRHLPDTPM